MKLINVAEMVALEKAADASGYSYAQMMQAAGAALAAQAGTAERVLCLVGKGNNGGDGLVAARILKQQGREVSAYLLQPREDELLLAAREAGVFVVEMPFDLQFRVLKNLILNADLLIDALLGTGTRLPLGGDVATLLGQVGAFLKIHRPYILACDCPSGVNCDTGAMDARTLQADETATFALAKVGLVKYPAAKALGKLRVLDIGLPTTSIKVELMDEKQIKKLMPARPDDAHKGTFGKAFIVAGSINYIGAAYLAAGSAYRAGAGLVTLGVPQGILGPLAGLVPEATWVLLPNEMGIVNKAAASVVLEEAAGYDALLVGCGIGDEDETREFMEKLLQPEQKKTIHRKGIGLFALNTEVPSDEPDSQTSLPPLVIDADGLNNLAKIENWWKLLPANTILTPHPREFARLAGLEDVAEVQANREKLAGEKAKAWKAIVVLKGANTVIAAPSGKTFVSPFASAKLATAGTGDVLAGVIVSLLAQGLKPIEAAQAGVWIHAYAAIHGVEAEYGVVASDVMLALGKALAHVYA